MENKPKSDGWIKLNSFLLGLIAVFVIINYTENHFKGSSVQQPKHKMESTKRKAKTSRNEQASNIDPRCNSRTPYYSGRWGCTVNPL